MQLTLLAMISPEQLSMTGLPWNLKPALAHIPATKKHMLFVTAKPLASEPLTTLERQIDLGSVFLLELRHWAMGTESMPIKTPE